MTVVRVVLEEDLVEQLKVVRVCWSKEKKVSVDDKMEIRGIVDFEKNVRWEE